MGAHIICSVAPAIDLPTVTTPLTTCWGCTGSQRVGKPIIKAIDSFLQTFDVFDSCQTGAVKHFKQLLKAVNRFYNRFADSLGPGTSPARSQGCCYTCSGLLWLEQGLSNYFNMGRIGVLRNPETGSSRYLLLLFFP